VRFTEPVLPKDQAVAELAKIINTLLKLPKVKKITTQVSDFSRTIASSLPCML
jgi:hypothetical protein